ncbi:MAG TPA: nuclear transport factor 2 family protein [Chthoniobacterales bacterium]
MKYKPTKAMKFASIIPASLLLFLGGFASPGFGQESHWGSPGEETVKFIVAAEAKWASSACSPQPDLKDVIADDFQGTSPSGRRYGKKDAIASDTKALERDCQLGEVKVRFFGDSIALAYGAESAVFKAKDSKETKHCLVWTDTWLKRAGKWQIVAAQDTGIPCNP